MPQPSDALTPTTPSQRRIAFAILLAGVVCMGMGQTIVFAVLPPIARSIGLGDASVLSIFMTSAAFWVISSPIWGGLSDRFGRRIFILLGLSGYALSMTLFALTIGIGQRGAIAGALLYFLLLLTRSIYGVIGSATPGAAQAYIADRTPIERRAASLSGYSAAFGFGAMVGPAFASAFANVGPLAPLYGVAAVAAVCAGCVIAFLPEKTPPRERVHRPRLSALDKRIRPFLIFGLATGIALSIPVQFIGFYTIDRLGLSGPAALQAVGIALSASAGASLLAQLFLVQRMNFEPVELMRVGPIALCIGHALIAFGSSTAIVACGMAMSGLGAGLLIPGAAAGASVSVSPEEQGGAAGLSNAAGASGFIFAPLIGFSLYSIDPRAVFLATALIGAGAASYAFAMKSTRTLR